MNMNMRQVRCLQRCAAGQFASKAVQVLEPRLLFALTIQAWDLAQPAIQLANEIVVPNTGVTVTDATYVGAAGQGGTFAGFNYADKVPSLALEDGIILTSGFAGVALGPNAGPSEGGGQGTVGDDDLDEIAGAETFDANSITIGFTVGAGVNSVLFDFVFGSEEYPEFVDDAYNDAFAAFLDGEQISFDTNNLPITVNNNFFQINNTTGMLDLEYDGLTPRIRSQAPVSPGSHTLKLVIADAGDSIYDSGVFISRLTGSPRTVSEPVTFVPDPGEVAVAGVNINESAGLAEITLLRQGGADGVISVDFSTIASSARADLDFTSTNGTIVFEDGQTTQVITVPILDDRLVEATEQFQVQFTNPLGGAGLANETTTVVIASDDSLIRVDGSAVSHNEGETATITLVREGDLSSPAVVSYSTADGSADATDYVATSGTLTFNTGETSKTIPVTISNDDLHHEAEETFHLLLSGTETQTLSFESLFMATISVLNVDPASPLVEVVNLSSQNGKITSLNVTFSEAMGPSATNTVSYTIWDRGIDGRYGYGRDRSIRVSGVTFDATTNTATVVPAKPLKKNRLYQLTINSSLLSDTSGNTLDSGSGVGQAYHTFFARGERIRLVDEDGDLVHLGAVNGGAVEVFRRIDGQISDVRLSGENASTHLTGYVQKRARSGGSTYVTRVNPGVGTVAFGSAFTVGSAT